MNRKVAKKVMMFLASGMLVAVVGAGANAGGRERANPPAEQQTLTGVISDSMCGATHMAKDKTPAECTRICAKQGMQYALVVDKKAYTLQGHEAELEKLAGQKVTVKGTVTGNTVTVDSVSMAK